MKTRNGFVSNSSSTSFVFDMRKPEVKEMMKKLNKIPHAEGLNRCTAMEMGKNVGLYALDWVRENDLIYFVINDYLNERDLKNTLDGDLGVWLLMWSDKLGEENILFLRESDEEMGGVLFGDQCLPYDSDFRKLAESETECH